MRRHTILSGIFLILAIVFLFYGIFIQQLHSGSRFYLIWFALAVFMLLLAGAFHIDGFSSMGRRLLVMLFLAFLLFVVVTWSCILRTFHAEGEDGLDDIVVLGAQVRASGPSRVLRYRLDAAADYLEKNQEALCVVSGGRGANEPEAEGTAMKAYLMEKGIVGKRIITETESANTVQNLVNSGRLIDRAGRVGIVTNDFHVFRAVQIARKNGYQHVCGIAAPSDAFYLPNNMLRESFGILKDFLAGNL